MFTNNKNGAIIILKVIDWRVKNMQRTYLCIDLKTFYFSMISLILVTHSFMLSPSNK